MPHRVDIVLRVDLLSSSNQRSSEKAHPPCPSDVRTLLVDLYRGDHRLLLVLTVVKTWGDTDHKVFEPPLSFERDSCQQASNAVYKKIFCLTSAAGFQGPEAYPAPMMITVVLRALLSRAVLLADMTV